MATGTTDRLGRGATAIVDITELAKGGAGLGHLPDGRVVFVAGSFPGDRVSVTLQRSKKRFAEATVNTLLSPSPNRVQPDCSLAGRCGGCQWMGLDYPTQLKAKTLIVRETLNRIGDVDRLLVEPTLPSAKELGYRARARLHWQDGRLGFYAFKGRGIVDVPTCPVLSPPLETTLKAVRAELQDRSSKSPMQLELKHNPDGTINGALSGVGANDIEIESGKIRAYPGPLAPRPRTHLPFAQANPLINAEMVKLVVDWLNPMVGKQFVDFYCGSGNFTYPLANAGGQVLGVEEREDAVSQARVGAAGRSDLTFVCSDAALLGSDLWAEYPRLEGVVLNPPRGGALALTPLLQSLRPHRIAYVSCDPATLARDLAALKATFKVERVQPFDMMPQTPHVEAVALLSLADTRR